MLCERPYFVAGKAPVGCGQCDICRVNRRRLWATRMYLESLCHDYNSFLTLTYSDEHIPENGSLVPEDWTKFMKRFRLSIAPVRVRFFAVGEYGDETQRPHFHASLFGVGAEAQGIVQRAWPFGHVYLAECSPATCAYVAGYVTKKWTRPVPLLHGRHPEFARQSNRPGIGAGAAVVLARALEEAGVVDSIRDGLGRLPLSVRIGGKEVFLGRYVRECMRKELGLSDEWKEEQTRRFFIEKEEELRPVRAFAWNNEKDFEVPGDSHSVKKALVALTKGGRVNFLSKVNVRRQRKTL